MLGNGRLEAQMFDDQRKTVLAHIRGKLRKKVWVNQGDIILLSLRDFQEDKADVLLRYTPDEARQLKTYGELPESARINESAIGEDGEDDNELGYEFAGSEDEVGMCYSTLFSCYDFIFVKFRFLLSQTSKIFDLVTSSSQQAALFIGEASLEGNTSGITAVLLFCIFTMYRVGRPTIKNDFTTFCLFLKHLRSKNSPLFHSK